MDTDARHGYNTADYQSIKKHERDSKSYSIKIDEKFPLRQKANQHLKKPTGLDILSLAVFLIFTRTKEEFSK